MSRLLFGVIIVTVSVTVVVCLGVVVVGVVDALVQVLNFLGS